MVDFLLDHGVVVYPINPKALDRARERFRQSGAKSDPFDARVAAEFLRTDHGHLGALHPSSEAAQELKYLTEDCQRLIRQQTRLVNQLTATLKAYYPRALEVAELPTALARDFLQAYPTPEALARLTERQWQRWAKAHRVSDTRAAELWPVLQQPQLPVPAHVSRAKAQMMVALVAALAPVVEAVATYRRAVDDFFGRMPAAHWARTLPVGEHGLTIPTLWARLGDAPARWTSFRHLQAQAGTVPVTKRSGKQQVVTFRFACDKPLRTVVDQLAFLSLRTSESARPALTRSAPGGIAIVMRCGLSGPSGSRSSSSCGSGRWRTTNSTTWPRWPGRPCDTRTRDSLDMRQRKSVAGPRSRCSHLRADTRAPA